MAFCLAVLLALQTVMFSRRICGERAERFRAVTVSEVGSPDATEPSVTEAVYGAPDITPLAVGPTDKTSLFMGKMTLFR